MRSVRSNWSLPRNERRHSGCPTTRFDRAVVLLPGTPASFLPIPTVAVQRPAPPAAGAEGSPLFAAGILPTTQFPAQVVWLTLGFRVAVDYTPSAAQHAGETDQEMQRRLRSFGAAAPSRFGIGSGTTRRAQGRTAGLSMRVREPESATGPVEDGDPRRRGSPPSGLGRTGRAPRAELYVFWGYIEDRMGRRLLTSGPGFRKDDFWLPRRQSLQTHYQRVKESTTSSSAIAYD